MRVLVTGAAGFVPSHVVDALIAAGHDVTGLDNFYTGSRRNLEHLADCEKFRLVEADVAGPLPAEILETAWDRIYHLACPASPPHYQRDMVQTLRTSTHGTYAMLTLAERCGARLLFSSTSEIYGDPTVHPQPESYWGNVNSFGPRACYDEGKRVSEAYCYSFAEQHGVDVRIARIFNTFGPRMDPADGRVVSNFIIAALRGEPLQIYGTGEQTRSFMYVADLVAGLLALMESDVRVPVNLGNPVEYTIAEWARVICEEVKSKSEIVCVAAAADDPRQRRPDISRAETLLGWAPRVPVMEGVRETIAYFRLRI